MEQQSTNSIQNDNHNHNLEDNSFVCAPGNLFAVIRGLHERIINDADQLVCIFVVHFIPADEKQVHRERLVWIQRKDAGNVFILH